MPESAIDILTELLDSLPPDHHERPGIIRAIEVLRSDLSAPKDDVVLVLLAATACDVDPKTRCVMEVIGPFPNRDDAAAFILAGVPEWTTPHFIHMKAPDAW